MQGKTHVLIGTAASVLLIGKFGFKPDILAIAAAAVGSLIPDIDHPKSMINQKILPVNNKLMKILAYAGGGAFLLYKNMGLRSPLLTMIGIFLIMVGLSHHRGFTHSIIGTAAVSAIVFMLFKSYGMENVRIAFIIGMISHLVADYFTTGGIEIFYPISKRNFSFPITIATGGIMENGLSIVIIFMMASIYLG
jgi:inner membrane protein